MGPEPRESGAMQAFDDWGELLPVVAQYDVVDPKRLPQPLELFNQAADTADEDVRRIEHVLLRQIDAIPTS